MPLSFFVFMVFFFLAPSVEAQGDGSLWPSWIPLVVRSPYVSTWLNSTNIPLNTSNIDGVARAPTVWSQCLEGQHCSIAGLIRIDQKRTFIWLGSPSDDLSGFNRSVLTNIEVTPTRTIMNMTAGPIDLSVTFLSPIEPANPVLQSLPMSYVSLEAVSNDGQPHEVQVYSDVTGEWISGDFSNMMTWSTQSTNALIYHQVALQNPQPMTEINDRIEDSTMFLAMPILSTGTGSQSYMVDTDVGCRSPFLENGTLTNQIITPPHVIAVPFPVFAISADLGSITTTKEPVVWALGMTRNPIVNYTGADGITQTRSPYWASQFNDPLDAVISFVADYSNALKRAIELDQKISIAAANVSEHYADLVSLAARQAMGGTELTIGRSTSSTGQLEWNAGDVKMFMKNVGTDGRINPVEGLYEAFPFFLYINATFGGWLLDPVLEFANSSRWMFSYAPRDIGTNYPNVTGNSAAHNQGVEQSGNMLIMTLAHARTTGDGSLIGHYYTLLKNWADYLVENTFPLSASQQSADTTDTKANLTNVALKGIIGIQAMAEMSTAMNISVDAQHYSSSATSLASLWTSQAVSPDHQHILTSFGDTSSSLAVTYNLFADKLLHTNLIPATLYTSQTESLKVLTSSSNDGLPIDSSLSQQANTVWSLLTAAYATDSSVRNGIIDQIWSRMSSNTTDIGIFSTAYRLDSTGASINNLASPFIGGVFAPLSLSMENTTIHIPSNTSSTSDGSPTDVPSNNSKKTSNAGAIAGGIIGSLGGAALLGLIGFIFWRRRRQRPVESPETGAAYVDNMAQPVPFVYESTFNPVSTSMIENPLSRLEAIPVSSKAREAMLDAVPQHRPSPSASGSSSTGSGTALVQDSSISTASTTVSPTGSSGSNVLFQSDVQGLRTEVENLRRVMQTLNEARYEPPPGYEPETGV